MTILLTNWSIRYHKDFYAPPNADPRSSFVVGTCKGHPKYKDGSVVQINKVISCENGKFRTYSGREYSLGEVNKEYGSLFPNAFARFVETVEKSGTKEL